MTATTDDRRLLGQLRSAGGRKAALTELRRRPPSALAADVVTVLRELLAQDDPGLRDAVIEVILGHPTASLIDAYEQIACRELPHRRAHALERLPMWNDRVALGELPSRVCAAAATTQHPWLQFLAALQSVRLGIDDGTGWQRAAQAIVASRIPDPMRCIRPEAEELLDPDERARVNAELRAQGAREL